MVRDFEGRSTSLSVNYAVANDTALDKLNEYLEQLEGLEMSISNATELSSEGVEILYDNYIKALENSIKSLEVAQARFMELRAQNSKRNSAMSNSRGSSASQEIFRMVMETQINSQIEQSNNLAIEMRAQLASLEQDRERVVLLIEVNQAQEALAILESSNASLSHILNQVADSQINNLQIDLPSLPDCPGPGCPLAS